MLSHSKSASDDDNKLTLDINSWNSLLTGSTSLPSFRCTTLLSKIFQGQVYPTRQKLLAHLDASEVTKFTIAIGGDKMLCPRERAIFLNPMRDLFTDDELRNLKADLAKQKDHRLVIWDNDLETFLQRAKNPVSYPRNQAFTF
jgi:hypothetical protein